jgi:rhodanese-related sulfurtransferase
MAGSLKLQQFTAAQISQEQHRGVLILDTRAAEVFATAHISGAMQLGLIGPFASWAAILIAPTQNLLLVAEDESSAQEAWVRLGRVGFEHVAGFTLADEEQWGHHGVKISSVSIHRCDEVLRGQQKKDRPFQLIDVRSPSEWRNGHLLGAISIPLMELDAAAAFLDFSRPSLVYCREGYRATTAASLLLRRNAPEIGIMIDAMQCIDGPQAGSVVEGPSIVSMSAPSYISEPNHQQFSVCGKLDDRFSGLPTQFRV